MTHALLIVSGALFGFEASMGLFLPRIYRSLEPASRRKRPWRLPLIGGALALWGVVCLVLSVPPTRLAHWVLIAVGAACVYKGLLMAFRPDLLRHTSDHIDKNPRRWRLQCGLRMVIGAAFVVWGTMTWLADRCD